MAELKERLSNIRRLKGVTTEVVRARVLGFLRFYDVCCYYTTLYNGVRYKPFYDQLKIRELEKHTELIERTLARIEFLPKAYIVEDFLSITTRSFYEFKVEVLGESFHLWSVDDLP
jgi:hypothetical protein